MTALPRHMRHRTAPPPERVSKYGGPKPLPPPVGERPIDRLLYWGDGRWGMVFGQPDLFPYGKPMIIEREP